MHFSLANRSVYVLKRCRLLLKMILSRKGRLRDRNKSWK